MNTRDPVADAWNEGENRYRQTVLGQGPLPGYPIISLNYDYCAKHDRYVNPRFGCIDCHAVHEERP